MGSFIPDYPSAQPCYASFRAEIDLQYPDIAKRIAISNSISAEDLSGFESDIQNQISPEIRAELSKHSQDFFRVLFKRYAGHAGFHDGVSFMFRDSLPSAKPLAPTSYCYMITGLLPHSPAELYARIANAGDNMGLAMTFNQAALDAPLLAWFNFYHELSHALENFIPDAKGCTSTDRKTAYEFKIAEMIADSFAALQLLLRFGRRAIPVLETMADMRLAKFAQWGAEHFTAPALRVIVADYNAGILNLNNADFLSMARNIAKFNFLYPDDVNEYQKVEEARKFPLGHMWTYDRLKITFDAYCKDSERKPWRKKQAALYAESQDLLNDKYFRFRR